VQIDARAEAEKVEQAELKAKAENSLEKHERKTKKAQKDKAEKPRDNGADEKK